MDGNKVEMAAGNSESTGNNEVAGHLPHPGASDYNSMLQLAVEGGLPSEGPLHVLNVRLSSDVASGLRSVLT